MSRPCAVDGGGVATLTVRSGAALALRGWLAAALTVRPAIVAAASASRHTWARRLRRVGRVADMGTA